MTRPTSRVLALLEILQSGGTRRVADLASHLAVDERTVRRYAEHLIDLDIPVRSVRGRYGGYELAPGYRMPPLMLTDDEAVAVVIGLVVGERAGLVPQSASSASALAKLRRVLPGPLRAKIEALLAAVSFTAPPRSPDPVDTNILLALAQAAHEGRRVEIAYTDRNHRTTTRMVRPRGVVAHGGHWYVTAVTDKGRRTFRLDRISAVTPIAPEPDDAETGAVPAGDESSILLESFARAPRAHQVSFRVQGTRSDVENRLPLGLVVVDQLEAGWVRVTFNAEWLERVPSLIAGLNLPFVIEGPDELRDAMKVFARRLEVAADQAL